MSSRMLTVLFALATAYAPVAAAQNDDTEMRFAGMDRDGDGVITRAEWRGNDRSFERHDSNGDGVLSGDEVRVGERRARRRSRDADLAGNPDWRMQPPPDLFTRVDANRNGSIARDEWPGSSGTFAQLDANRDGRLSREELSGTPAEGTRGRAYQAGYERGLADGRQAGREDHERSQGWDLEGQRELEQADSGYEASMGSRTDYQEGYRQAFRLGYRQGWEAAEGR